MPFGKKQQSTMADPHAILFAKLWQALRVFSVPPRYAKNEVKHEFAILKCNSPVIAI